MHELITIESEKLNTVTGGADSIGAEAGRRAANVVDGFKTGGIGGAASALGGMFAGWGGGQQQGPVSGPATSPARPGMAGLALRERMKTE